MPVKCTSYLASKKYDLTTEIFVILFGFWGQQITKGERKGGLELERQEWDYYLVHFTTTSSAHQQEKSIILIGNNNLEKQSRLS